MCSPDLVMAACAPVAEGLTAVLNEYRERQGLPTQMVTVVGCTEMGNCVFALPELGEQHPWTDLNCQGVSDGGGGIRDAGASLDSDR
jgi:hypothetical protein